MVSYVPLSITHVAFCLEAREIKLGVQVSNAI